MAFDSSKNAGRLLLLLQWKALLSLSLGAFYLLLRINESGPTFSITYSCPPHCLTPAFILPNLVVNLYFYCGDSL